MLGKLYTALHTIWPFIPHILSVLAILISLIAFRRTGKHQRIVEDLVKRQIEQYDRESNETDISVRLVNHKNSIFILKNEGKVEAKNIHFEFMEDIEKYAIIGEHQFLENEDNKKIFLIKTLYPKNKYHIYVTFSSGGPKYSYEVSYSWENPDGKRAPREWQVVTLEH